MSFAFTVRNFAVTLRGKSRFVRRSTTFGNYPSVRMGGTNSSPAAAATSGGTGGVRDVSQTRAVHRDPFLFSPPTSETVEAEQAEDVAAPVCREVHSVLTDYTKVKGVLVASNADWDTFGAQAWKEMLAGLQEKKPMLRVLGVDTEWYKKNPLATLQVATASHVIIIHLSYLSPDRQLPRIVCETLENPGIIKCGCGLNNDVSRLQKEQQVRLVSLLDLGCYAVWMEQTSVGNTNLKKILSELVPEAPPIPKSDRVTRSNWELPLSDEQIEYCADDAIASFLVGEKLMRVAGDMHFNGNYQADASVWLCQTGHHASAAFKRQQKEKTKEMNELQKEKQKEACAAASTGGDMVAEVAVTLQSNERVRVIDKEGKFLFDISAGRAKFYVKEKGIAKVTVPHPTDSRKAREIQLLFDPRVKTRLCMYFNTGFCEMGEACPFAHGIDQLTDDARELALFSKSKDAAGRRVPTCACCFTNVKLMRHSIVPPSFRRYLPEPVKWCPDKDYVPLCTQCNSVVRKFYDLQMSNVYRDADDRMKALSGGVSQCVDMNAVAKCGSYARLLLNENQMKVIPESRKEFLREFILLNWKATHLEEMRGVKMSKKNNRRRKSCGGAPASAALDNGGQHGDSVSDDNGDEEEQDVDFEEEKKEEVEQAGASVETLAELPTSTEPGTTLSVEFLKELSAIVPGEVRAKVAMDVLIGHDVDKAKAFVESWRTFCFTTCGMQQKESNDITQEEWKAYRNSAQNMS